MNSQPRQANDAPPIDWDKYHTEKLKLKKPKPEKKK